MTLREAEQVRMGDLVAYDGFVHRVLSISTQGIAAPHFRLEGVKDGLTSYRLVGWVVREEN